MRNVERLCSILEDEIGKIADKGLTTSNLDTTGKIIDMLKDIKMMAYYKRKEEYYDDVTDEMRGGGSSYAMGYDGEYSGRRHRDSRGRYARNDGPRGMERDRDRDGMYDDDGYSMGRRGGYSRSDGDDYDRYIREKHSYRNGEKTGDCKRRMLDALERHLDALTTEISDMGRDADCAEEKETIMRYMDKLKREL